MAHCRRQGKVEVENADNGSSGSKVQDSTEKQSNVFALESDPDFISALPQHLLIHILCLLPTKDAVRTSILAKKWCGLWNLVDTLDLSWDYGDAFEKMPLFISHIDRNLMRYPNIKKFSLQLGGDVFYDDFKSEFENDGLLEKWIKYVLEKKVAFLMLGFFEFWYKPHDWFYISSSLIELTLYRLQIHCKTEVVSWCLLRKLVLRDVNVDEENLLKLLSGCPILEDMTLDSMSYLTRLHIQSPKLKKLTIVDYEDDILEINAPWLRQLEISGDFECDVCPLVDVSSLEYAKLTFSVPYHSGGFLEKKWFDLSTKILEKVQHVLELELGSLFIQVLSVLKLLEKPLPMFNCRKLRIEAPILKYELSGIACILDSSPHLEKLMLNLLDKSRLYFKAICYFDGKEYLSLQTGNLTRLKNVAIVHHKRFCFQKVLRTAACFDFELASYLVKNAHALEQLIITSRREDYYNRCNCLLSCTHRYLSMLSHRLMGVCLDCRTAADWDFKKRNEVFEFSFCSH